MLKPMLSVQSVQSPHTYGFKDPIRRPREMMAELETRANLVVTPDPASWIFCQGAERHSNRDRPAEQSIRRQDKTKETERNKEKSREQKQGSLTIRRNRKAGRAYASRSTREKNDKNNREVHEKRGVERRRASFGLSHAYSARPWLHAECLLLLHSRTV